MSVRSRAVQQIASVPWHGLPGLRQAALPAAGPSVAREGGIRTVSAQLRGSLEEKH